MSNFELEMEWSSFFTHAFDYDRWANRQWLSSLGGFKKMNRAHEILEHILSAQQIWLKRCGGEVSPQQDDISLQELFDFTASNWIAVLEQRSPDEVILYHNSLGNQYAQPIYQIALHVINHGTYHRGQLRGLAEADGFNGFPETDLIGFFREHNGSRITGSPLSN